MATFTGSGNSFDAARRDAAQEAVAATQTPDAMVVYKVNETRGQYGGIAGLDSVEVDIEA